MAEASAEQRNGTKWVKDTIDKLGRYEPNQIVVLTYRVSKSTQLMHTVDEIVKQAAQRYPTALIKVRSWEFLLSNYAEIGRLKAAVPHVGEGQDHLIYILVRMISPTLNDALKSLPLLNNLEMFGKKQKLLEIILDHHEKSAFGPDEFEYYLVVAFWQFKFFDYSIILAKPKTKILMYCNLFENVAIDRKELSSSKELFPDKFAFTLKNHRVRYPLDHRFASDKYYAAIHQDSPLPGRISAFWALDFFFTFASTNATTLNSKYFKNYTRDFVRDHNHELSRTTFIPVFMMLTPFEWYKLVQPFMEFQATALIVPVIKLEAEISFPLEIIVPLIFFPALIGLYLLLAKLFRLPNNPWSITNLAAVIFLNGRLHPLSGIREKVLYLCLVIVSFLLASDVLMALTQMGFTRQELPLENIKQIREANLTISATFPDNMMKYLLDPNSYGLYKEIIRVDSGARNDGERDLSCLRAARNETMCCIMFESNYYEMCKIAETLEHLRGLCKSLRVSEDWRHSKNHLYYYPRCFYLVNEARAAYQRAFETGMLFQPPDSIFRISAEEYHAEKQDLISAVSDLSQNLDTLGLWMLLGVGCGLGFLAFCGEIVYSILKKRREHTISRRRNSREHTPWCRYLLGKGRALLSRCNKRGHRFKCIKLCALRPRPKKINARRILVAERTSNRDIP